MTEVTARTMSHARFAAALAYLSKSISGWSGDSLTLEDRLATPINPTTAARFVADMRAWLDYIEEEAGAKPLVERVRHLKRGASYRVLVRGARLQSASPITDGETLVVYVAETDGTTWCRPAAEFDDGRFVPAGGVPRSTDVDDELLAVLDRRTPATAAEAMTDVRRIASLLAVAIARAALMAPEPRTVAARLAASEARDLSLYAEVKLNEALRAVRR